MNEVPVIGSYQTIVNGQVVTVERLAPTKADKIERDTSRLSWHRRSQDRLNRQPVREYLKEGKK